MMSSTPYFGCATLLAVQLTYVVCSEYNERGENIG